MKGKYPEYPAETISDIRDMFLKSTHRFRDRIALQSKRAGRWIPVTYRDLREKVEHTAQITLASHQLGRARTLPAQAVETLTEMRRELLQRQGRDICEGCSICVLGDEYQPPSEITLAGTRLLDEEALVQRVARSVLSALQYFPQSRLHEYGVVRWCC